MSDNQLSCHLVTLKITSGTYFCCVLIVIVKKDQSD